MSDALDLPPPARGSAPAQYVGYGLQTVRLCYHLLNADHGETTVVSVEHSDDTAVHLGGGEIILEQSKSALRSNPVANWAPDLWKTFANWLDEIEAGRIDLKKARFRLYVTPIKSGVWVNLLSNASSDHDVDLVFNDVEQALKKRPTKPPCLDHLAKVLHADPTRRRELFKRFTFQSCDQDPADPIKVLMKVFLPEALVEISYRYAVGLAKTKSDKLIQAGTPGALSVGAFRSEVKTFVQQHNLERLLVSLTDPPSAATVKKKLEERPQFVRQLEIIEIDEESVVRAVSDFLQASADKTAWAERGVIVKDSLRDYDDRLLRQHKAISTEIHALHKASAAEDRGQALYGRCLTVSAPFFGREVPNHFIPGCYNSLADRLELGWHPNYQHLLGTKAA